MRILFDELGNSHADLFMKIDAIPSVLIVSDSYFFSDFLEIECETKQGVVLKYINYLKSSFIELSNKQLFVPVDLSDEYIGGLLIKNWKKGLIEITECHNKNLFGWAVTKSNIHSEAEKHWTSFQKERTLHIAKESIISGLDWSINNLRKNNLLS